MTEQKLNRRQIFILFAPLLWFALNFAAEGKLNTLEGGTILFIAFLVSVITVLCIELHKRECQYQKLVQESIKRDYTCEGPELRAACQRLEKYERNNS